MIEERAGKFVVNMDEAVPVVVGAIATGAVDAGVEAFSGELDRWGQSWGFPAWAGRPLFGVEPLPPLDDWLIDLVGPGATALIGAIAKNKEVTNAGIGGLIFGVPELLANMVIRTKQKFTIPAFTPPPTPSAQRYVQGPRYIVRG